MAVSIVIALSEESLIAAVVTFLVLTFVFRRRETNCSDAKKPNDIKPIKADSEGGFITFIHPELGRGKVDKRFCFFPGDRDEDENINGSVADGSPVRRPETGYDEDGNFIGFTRVRLLSGAI
jgi:hypothetical protein